MLQRTILTLIFFSFYSISLFAQTGIIKGNVKDALTQEAIIGANIVIEGTTNGAATDVEGNFIIPKAPAGNHSLLITYISYRNKKIENVRVETGKTTLINTVIEEDVAQLRDVVVVGTRQTNTEVAVITEIKRAEQVAVGISSEQIVKSQDRDAAQIIRRVPGISIVDDRFVMVRGLSERYNTVMLNDAITPSSEVDVKAFSFDIIPSSAIDRLLIFKSGAAELPGEFAGGVIKIYTKNIPDRNEFSVSVTGGYRQGTTFKDFATYSGGKTDWLGFDDGTRAIPSSFPSQFNTLSAAQRAELSKQLPNNWSYKLGEAMPDMRASLNFARRFFFGNVDVGNITTLSYSNTRLYTQPERYRYENFSLDLGRSSDTSFAYKDDQYTNNVRLGIMHNWAFQLNPTNKIEFRNLFNQMSTKETILREGYVGNDNEVRNYAFRFESRSIYSGQLNGTHNLSDNTTIKWTGGLAYTYRAEPDYRRTRSSRQLGATELPFGLAAPTSANPFEAARFHSELNETVFMGNGNIEHKINLKGSTEEEDQLKLRAGFYVESKQRDFKARFFTYRQANSGTFDNNLTFLPLNQIYNPENLNTTSGFLLDEGIRPQDTYEASNLLAAGYVGATIPLNKLNISAGFRGEYNKQQIQSGNEKKDFPIFSPLPSANLTYNFSDLSLVRLAYTYTVNRPEFRELARFSYYDFEREVEVVGNPDLDIARIHNIDARWEFYPSPSELISIGAFYKYFDKPIEQNIRVGTSTIQYTFNNALYSTSLGAELEVRKSFLTLSNNKFIQNLTVLLNASLIKSNIEFDPILAEGQASSRPMMGQSPYLINAGLYYNDEDSKLQVNILYNVYGKRIYAVGNYAYPDQYEMPRNVIDLNITKGFGEHFRFQAGIQDILNQPLRIIQDSNRDAKITTIDEKIMLLRRGTYSNISLSYIF